MLVFPAATAGGFLSKCIYSYSYQYRNSLTALALVSIILLNRPPVRIRTEFNPNRQISTAAWLLLSVTRLWRHLRAIFHLKVVVTCRSWNTIDFMVDNWFFCSIMLEIKRVGQTEMQSETWYCLNTVITGDVQQSLTEIQLLQILNSFYTVPYFEKYKTIFPF